ncbi:MULTISPECIES: branched-chain amino acid ABC transporter permease [unclassified Rhizobium]|uniref:branched-chain amino acid ABC transporter permease n=1 Tax=unclassified Rhizobium TaxID=2613769 RepID=UPI001620C34C|nr:MULTISPECIES: branched-chain amino acid ABC transporter permease [unclassified Rhizobium]MBB3289067.1 branched-chain amino acid transport system permease protein [Rhizobium sp. BK252]MBB3403809.1 branched-chain amino acid transport system permease protein [Rhizobium sp. BK289]MBB3416522.1 branched-chain amino acid transport system permease protein [Rhizobium sp. BK284]MBB3484272.1 branched-chain amino acid transport system permease protein [Rhizobium sp. BK347]
MNPSRVLVNRHTLSSKIAIPLALCLLLAIPTLPFWAPSGQIRLVIELSCFIAIAQMWNLLAGYGGMVSVGQQAFIGAGGYSLFALSSFAGLNPFLAVPLAIILPAVLAAPSYLLLRKLDGPYFAIGTWVLAETFRLITNNLDVVNAGSGMTLRAMGSFTPHQREIGLTVLCALLLLATVGGTFLLLRSRLGLALTAMRDDPVSAASQGVNVNRMRFAIYVVAAMGTGLAGAIYYMAQLRISPTSGFDPYWSSICIFIVMVGGIGHIEGPIIGALLYFFATRIFGQYGASYLVVLGVLTMVMALFSPTGLWGILNRIRHWPWFPVSHTVVRPDTVQH